MDIKNNVALQPVPTIRASEAIFHQIRDMILSGELKPGDRLPSERSMMDMMKRSRPTIREAMRLLESAGLIRINSGAGGITVLEPSDGSVRLALESLITRSAIDDVELLEYRKLNEINAAGWAAERRSPAQLAAMRDYLDKIDWLSLPADKLIPCDFGFRRLLAVASNNRLFAMVDEVLNSLVFGRLQSFFTEESPASQMEMREAVDQSYLVLLPALERRDAPLSRKLMKEHIEIFATRRDRLIEERTKKDLGA